MIEAWRRQMAEHSGNLTTNQAMPPVLVEKILEEDLSLGQKIHMETVTFPELDGKLRNVEGLNILAGLQSRVKENCLTLFRGIRFPTTKRLHDMVHTLGYSMSNFEQERISTLYDDTTYIERRNMLKSDPMFWTQPQERVVPGLPVFALVNDALQIHRAFRGLQDMVAMCSIHIPAELLESRKVKLISNTAIDLNNDTDERDFEIENFKRKNGHLEIDYRALRARGIDLHEMYTPNLPLDLAEAQKMGIEQDFYLLNIARIIDKARLNDIFRDTQVLEEHAYFMHGFFGDQNIFGRRRTEYLPYACQSVGKIEEEIK